MKRARIDSEPVRRGDVYCSRRCGSGCTYAAYLVVKERAERVATLLGDGWHARVHDNLGWHWSVYYGRDPFGISISASGNQYMLIVNGFGQSGNVYHGTDPKALIARARRDVLAFADRIARAAGEFPA